MPKAYRIGVILSILLFYMSNFYIVLTLSRIIKRAGSLYTDRSPVSHLISDLRLKTAELTSLRESRHLRRPPTVSSLAEISSNQIFRSSSDTSPAYAASFHHSRFPPDKILQALCRPLGAHTAGRVKWQNEFSFQSYASRNESMMLALFPTRSGSQDRSHRTGSGSAGLRQEPTAVRIIHLNGCP